jgi:hypothetical protein
VLATSVIHPEYTAGGNKGIGRLTGSRSVYVGGNPTVTDAMTYNLLG